GTFGGSFGGNFGGGFGGNFGGRSLGGSFGGGLTGNGLNFNPHEMGQSSPFGFSTSGRVDGTFVVLVFSQRNAPALLGAGLIDRIPARVLEEVAASQASSLEEAKAAAKISSSQLSPGFVFGFGSNANSLPGSNADTLPVSGRVARLKDGRVGRFGWKAQTATLREFTLQASAVEIGLEVP